MREIIGLVGAMCSGKDSWANYFSREHGFAQFTTSDVARAHIAKHELGKPTRDLTRETATHLRQTYGSFHLAKTALEICKGRSRVILSGLYVPDEVHFVKQEGGLIVHIGTPQDIRFGRMGARSREGEIGCDEEFNRLNENDMRATDTDQKLEAVLALADIEIDGAVSFEDQQQISVIAGNVLAALRNAKETNRHATN